MSAFENDPDIFRYSWFAGRNANNSVAILGADGVLTPLGNEYIGADYGPKNNIPGTVQVEDMYRRRGTDFQACLDAGGGQNVGWTDAGTWNEYIVNIATTGSYTFTFRIASDVNTGSFNILLNDQLIHSNVTVNATGGWQTWTDLTIPGIVLPAGEHLLKFVFTGNGTNMNYFSTVFESTVPASANFSATPLSACVGNTVTFTNLTTNLTGGETYTWDFGTNAAPATASGPGPHEVIYSASGNKTIALSVTNANGTNTNTKNNYVTVAAIPTDCIFSDHFNDNTVNWLTPIPGAFAHAEAGSDWTISNNGYGEWQNFVYELNNTTTAMPINFQCAAHTPVLKVRAKASANCLLSIAMVDNNGRVVDNYNGLNLELTTSYQTFSIDFSGRFRNYYSVNPGILDSSSITGLQLSVNPGFFSYPITGANGTYNAYFPGTIDIDWIGIGDNSCNVSLPIDLISFEVSKQSSTSALLQWSTLSETNNDYFEILRSTDGINFTSAGTVNGNGTTSSIHQYTFTDTELGSGLYYYQLKQVDFNSDYTLTHTISVNMNEPVLSVVMPTYIASGDLIKILLDNQSKQISISLVDLTGKVYHHYPYAVKELETKGLPAGLYLVRIISDDQAITKKITVY